MLSDLNVVILTIFYISFHMTYPHFTLPTKTRSYETNPSYRFASSLSVHSEYLSFSLRHPASRTFVQRFPSPASIAQCSVLCPESSLAFSIEFSVVSSPPTLCTTLASSCLVSVPSPPSFPHLSSSFYIVSTFSKV